MELYAGTFLAGVIVGAMLVLWVKGWNVRPRRHHPTSKKIVSARPKRAKRPYIAWK